MKTDAGGELSTATESRRVIIERDTAPLVTIVVPVIRQPERLRQCLLSAVAVARHDEIPVHLVVVLDGADADVQQFVANDVKGATVLSWPERRGFAAGLNAGFRVASTPYVAVLQDDTEVQPGWLSSTVRTAELYPRAAAIGSLVLWPDRRVQAAGALIGADAETTIPWIGHGPAAETFTDVRAMDYVGSSSVLVRRQAWADVGGFDEDLYPVQYVDADFCTALWNAGWQVVCDPGSVVLHVRGGSSSSSLKALAGGSNRLRFLLKWGEFVSGRPNWLLAIPTAEEVASAVDRAQSWLETPPPVTIRASRGAPVESPVSLYVLRERELYEGTSRNSKHNWTS